MWMMYGDADAAATAGKSGWYCHHCDASGIAESRPFRCFLCGRFCKKGAAILTAHHRYKPDQDSVTITGAGGTLMVGDELTSII